MKTAMQNHIADMKKIQEMVKSKNLDKDLEVTILESIEGCIENAESFLEAEKELTLMPYGNHNGIVIYCKNCGSEFEETAEGYYPPIKYESDKHNRECRRCLTELGMFS